MVFAIFEYESRAVVAWSERGFIFVAGLMMLPRVAIVAGSWGNLREGQVGLGFGEEIE